MLEFFKKLIEEIHHRSLWQVTLVYVGGGWAMLGHVDLLQEFGAPDRVFDAAAIILVVGYVVVFGIATWPRVMRRSESREIPKMVVYPKDAEVDDAAGYRSEIAKVEEGPGDVRLGPEEPERAIGLDFSRERFRGFTSLFGKSGADEVPQENLAELKGQFTEGKKLREPLSAGLPKRQVIPAGLAVLVALAVFLWGRMILEQVVPAGPLTNGSPVLPLFLVALWPIVVILGFSFVRRRRHT